MVWVQKLSNIIVLERRPEQLIIQSKNGVFTVPRTSYYTLKYDHFGGNRIFHKFVDDIRVEETYNDGIFNIWMNDNTMQISDAETICDCILNKDLKKIRETFMVWYSEKVRDDVIKCVLAPYANRAVINEDGSLIVDGLFKVDIHGAAHYLDEKWEFLCIVASGTKSTLPIKLPNYGKVDITPRTLEIIAKAFFLLHPNIHDGVFMSQLPDKIKEHVHKIAGYHTK